MGDGRRRWDQHISLPPLCPKTQGLPRWGIDLPSRLEVRSPLISFPTLFGGGSVNVYHSVFGVHGFSVFGLVRFLQAPFGHQFHGVHPF